MKNILASIFVGLLSGFTMYLLIDNLFERPNKSVKDDPDSEQDLTEDPEPSIVYEDDDDEKEDGWKIKPNLKDIAKAK